MRNITLEPFENQTTNRGNVNLRMIDIQNHYGKLDSDKLKQTLTGNQ